jgi:hypothetical protein
MAIAMAELGTPANEAPPAIQAGHDEGLPVQYAPALRTPDGDAAQVVRISETPIPVLRSAKH